METFVVYALVVLFFLLTLGFVGTVLAKHPYRESAQTARTALSRAQPQREYTEQDRKLGYSLLALLFLGLCALAVLDTRKARARHV